MRLLALPLVAAIALAGCSRPPAAQQDLDRLDNELADAGNQRDPAAAGALRDPVLTDPQLAQTSNANAVRPPPRPDPGGVPPDATGARADPVAAGSLRHAPAPAGDCPSCRRADGALTLAELARRQPGSAAARCAGQLRYSAGWANKLPAAAPLYPDARVTEAAGADTPGCVLRIVSFRTGAPVGKVIDYYYTRASAAGYGAEHQASGDRHVIGGTKGDGAYVAYVSPDPGGGSIVDLIANRG